MRACVDVNGCVNVWMCECVRGMCVDVLLTSIVVLLWPLESCDGAVVYDVVCDVWCVCLCGHVWARTCVFMCVCVYM